MRANNHDERWKWCKKQGKCLKFGKNTSETGFNLWYKKTGITFWKVYHMQFIVSEVKEQSKWTWSWYCTPVNSFKRQSIFELISSRMSQKSVATCYWFQKFYFVSIMQMSMLKPHTCRKYIMPTQLPTHSVWSPHISKKGHYKKKSFYGRIRL